MLVQKSTIVGIAIVSFALLFPSVADSAPSPKPSPYVLTQTQRNLIATADANFAAAKVSARDGFDRAVADAKAIRDQAIANAGVDKLAINSARENFQDFYKSISHAYKIALANARAVRRNALAVVHLPPTTK